MEGINLAKIANMPPQREWRQFLDHLRPSVRPLVLWIRGRVWIGSAGRSELASAIGSSRVGLVVSDDIGRGLATALRWLGVDVDAYGIADLYRLEAKLNLDPGTANAMLQRVY
ncbi:hypothetical protein DB30_01816 [Enhygromyxa salina]|uniref:Uncharacterized protein n=1 Tax=Enhygromyxa salina TaxID=215803 RepID=A0A0C2CWK1_9BACT|nr:hypothetical protein DB30_01816 [Enhygromyxa salina]